MILTALDHSFKHLNLVLLCPDLAFDGRDLLVELLDGQRVALGGHSKGPWLLVFCLTLGAFNLDLTLGEGQLLL